MSADSSVECRSICRSIHRSRGAQNTRDPKLLTPRSSSEDLFGSVKTCIRYELLKTWRASTDGNLSLNEFRFCISWIPSRCSRVQPSLSGEERKPHERESGGNRPYGRYLISRYTRESGCLENSDLETSDLRPQTSKTQTSKTRTSKPQTSKLQTP